MTKRIALGLFARAARLRRRASWIRSPGRRAQVEAQALVMQERAQKILERENLLEEMWRRHWMITTERDGSSMEHAIVVGRVSDEYQYIAQICGDYARRGQALLCPDERAYDKVEVETKDGEVRTFWFDITSFMGESALREQRRVYDLAMARARAPRPATSG